MDIIESGAGKESFLEEVEPGCFGPEESGAGLRGGASVGLPLATLGVRAGSCPGLPEEAQQIKPD